MSGFRNNSDGDFERVYMTEYELVDKFVGTKLWSWGGYGTGTGGSPATQTGSGGTTWKQIATGVGTLFAINSLNELWACGYNNVGQVGDGTNTGRASLVQVAGGGTTWKQVSARGYSASAIKTDGSLWQWGNPHGSSPIIATGFEGNEWKQVSAGGNDGGGAVKTDGTLWTWGANNYGALGMGSTFVFYNRTSPGQTITGGNDWKKVAAGVFHMAAIKTDGTLYTWGDNYYGATGDGSYLGAGRPTPGQTSAGGTNWKEVACGNQTTAAIKTDGTLWTWGYGYHGGTGGGGGTVPAMIAGGGTNWKNVTLGNYNGAAVKTDGTAWTWGNDAYGELGDGGTNTSRSSPVTVLGNSTWKHITINLTMAAGVAD